MKKTILITAIGFSCYALQAQNVGIGTANPAEKLDVNGSINVTGTIKANGTDGQPNQVLMKNSTGTLAWGSICDFKNFKQFEYTGIPGPQTFTIPAGVTKVAVELWGGGGGGSQGGGGGAGGYTFGIIDVFAGGTADIIVGNGGAGATGAGSGTSGEESRFTFNLTTAIGAGGGGGAFSSFPGSGGIMGAYSTNIMYLNIPGGSGKKNFLNYQQYSATDYALYTKYGNGGVACMQVQTKGEGGHCFVNTNTGFTINEDFGSQGMGIGEGGGGGKSFGYPGAAGRVIVRW